MMFTNREQAAELLVERLAAHKGGHPLVLAIPRGAVPMGRIIADALGGELDVVLVRKLGAPGESEYAIGSVAESGEVTMNPDARGMADAAYVKQEVERQLELMRKRRALYTPVHPPADPSGRIAIVVDDGIATGSTMIAALRAIRARKPRRLIAAVGVAPPRSIRRLEKLADEVVCLHATDEFFAVGQFFADFPQVSDEEVVRILKG